MKKAALMAIMGLAAAGCFACFWVLRGERADEFFSSMASRRSPFIFSFQKVRMEHLARISFDSAEARPARLVSQGESAGIRSGPGSVETDLPFFMARSARVILMNVRLAERLEANVLRFLGMSKNAVPRALEIRKVQMKIYRNEGRMTWRILKMEARDFSLKGGFTLDKNRIEKASVAVSLGEALWRRFPKEIYSRMRALRNRRRGFEFAFSGTTLSLRGRYGPWLVAHWQDILK